MAPDATAPIPDLILLGGLAGLGLVAVVLVWKLTKAVVRIALILAALAGVALAALWLFSRSG